MHSLKFRLERWCRLPELEPACATCRPEPIGTIFIFSERVICDVSQLNLFRPILVALDWDASSISYFHRLITAHILFRLYAGSTVSSVPNTLTG